MRQPRKEGSGMNSKSLIPQEQIGKKIFTLRGQRVMLSNHLAEIYEVKPKVLIQAVKRSIERFPEDFMFQLASNEWQSLRSQIVTLEPGRGLYPKYPPYAFTEQGISMLSSVLKSEKAIMMNVAIMRAFVQMKKTMVSHETLSKKFEELEKKLKTHDGEIKLIFNTIQTMLKPVQKKKRKIGFDPKDK